MNERLVLMDGEKEKLVDEILDLRQRVKVLQAELEALKKKSQLNLKNRIFPKRQPRGCRRTGGAKKRATPE
jgi:hypothetical protein